MHENNPAPRCLKERGRAAVTGSARLWMDRLARGFDQSINRALTQKLRGLTEQGRVTPRMRKYRKISIPSDCIQSNPPCMPVRAERCLSLRRAMFLEPSKLVVLPRIRAATPRIASPFPRGITGGKPVSVLKFRPAGGMEVGKHLTEHRTGVRDFRSRPPTGSFAPPA